MPVSAHLSATPRLHPPHTSPPDTLSISSLSPEELRSSSAAPAKEAFPSERGARPLPFPAGAGQRELAGWAGSFQSQSNLKPGDLIEISRGVFAHWALYVGDGYVVHLAPPGEITSAALANIMSSGTDRAIVKKELLSEVVGNHWYRVNNKHDQKYPPLPPSQIVQRAEEQVGKVMPYKLTSANCEHFVNKLRYGVSYSDQVRPQPVSLSPAT
ncbi:hypothetical protein QTO34_003263 [Cnephaeus nilssonii]|uniref:LRAT domain-containing protein n=1 Tax=Cnephaeus nilssonii TaxID=3371016 RepID=A0AA40LKG1_CNENI|nr:hypothetical protein QTO34_003263 [Eptesicus nilssonii]